MHSATSRDANEASLKEALRSTMNRSPPRVRKTEPPPVRAASLEAFRFSEAAPSSSGPVVRSGPRQSLWGVGMERTRILLIDDEPALRDAVETFLDAHNFQVTTVASDREAREAVDREMPDLVLLSAKLSDGDAAALVPFLAQDSA